MAAMILSSEDGNDSAWYTDSRASNHVTNDLANLNIAFEFQGNSKLQIGNGTGLLISHVGNSHLRNSFLNSKPFVLKNLLHVPKITKNLLSVSQFAKDNSVFFEFHFSICLVKDQVTQQVLLKGLFMDEFYNFDV